MSWIYLIFAGLFEIGWPLGFKLADVHPSHRVLFLVIACLSMAVSGTLLYIAQKGIPIGTAYAVWTGIGAVGTLLIGILAFGDSTSAWRMVSAFFIIVGIIGLKLAH